jgi:thiol-disulfide isomerase/thioredoxin
VAALCLLPGLQASAPADLGPLRALLATANARMQAVQNRPTEADQDQILADIRAQGREAKGELQEASLLAEWYVVARAVRTEALARRVIAEIPPTSAAWELDPGMLPHVKGLLGAEGGGYYQRLRDTGIAAVRARLRGSEIQQAARTGALAEADEQFALLQKELPGQEGTKRAAEFLKVAHRSAVGAVAPDFQVKDLEHPDAVITKDAFKGKYLLLDFWATWCGFCVAELPNTHKLYAQYKAKGLEVLSLSVDAKAESVATFRAAAAHPMPWRHAFLGAGRTGTPILEAYGVTGFPTLFLLGPDGKILANGMELRGEKLAATLARCIPQ